MSRLAAVTLALAVFFWTGTSVAENNPTGIWKWRLFNQTAEKTLELTLDGDKLGGFLLRRDKKVPIEEASYKDGKIVFKVVVTSELGDGLKIPIRFSGTLSGDKINGTIEYTHPNQTITREWNASRVRSSN